MISLDGMWIEEPGKGLAWPRRRNSNAWQAIMAAWDCMYEVARGRKADELIFFISLITLQARPKNQTTSVQASLTRQKSLKDQAETRQGISPGMQARPQTKQTLNALRAKSFLEGEGSV